jgi:hypothetical protein
VRVAFSVLALTICNVTVLLKGASTPQPQELIAGIEEAQQRRDQRLAGYVAMEHYTLRNSHFKAPAELAAKTFYTRDAGKNYQVLWRKGPEWLHKRVINRIMNDDASLSRKSERPHILLTSANYSMKFQGIRFLRGQRCYAVNIRPKARRFSLIEGTAWFDANDFSLLRIEGKPATSPSFWTGRPFIERDYTVVDGVSLPQRSRATSSGIFAGKSELDIDYSDYVIAK